MGWGWGSAILGAQVEQPVRTCGIEFVDADWPLAHDAGSFKSKYKMSYADCFAAALAKQKRAMLLTGDPEFKQVESQVTIDWL